MFAHLELVPRDILEHIAFLIALPPLSMPVLRPPQDLLNLLLTSSTLYYSLCTTSAPHLYARLFRSIFDFDMSDVYQATNSRLTAQLVSRYRLLKRIRRRDFSIEMLREDLCVAMQTILESNGVNEAHLRSMGFTNFVFCYVEKSLNEHQFCFISSESSPDHTLELALWLLVLIWSKGQQDKGSACCV